MTKSKTEKTINHESTKGRKKRQVLEEFSIDEITIREIEKEREAHQFGKVTKKIAEEKKTN
jgi:hypothetical protein